MGYRDKRKSEEIVTLFFHSIYNDNNKNEFGNK